MRDSRVIHRPRKVWPTLEPEESATQPDVSPAAAAPELPPLVRSLLDLPAWLFLGAGISLLTTLGGLTLYIVWDGFTWWSLLPGFVAMCVVGFVNLVVTGKRGEPAGTGFVGLCLFLGSAFLSQWLVRDGFTWWVLLPGFAALCGMLTTPLLFQDKHSGFEGYEDAKEEDDSDDEDDDG